MGIPPGVRGQRAWPEGTFVLEFLFLLMLWLHYALVLLDLSRWCWVTWNYLSSRRKEPCCSQESRPELDQPPAKILIIVILY